MVTRTNIVLICDNCGVEKDLVDTHYIEVDGVAVETEVCDTCWKKVIDKVEPLVKEGRKLKVPKRNGKARSLV